jgi:hypothetical protein
MAPPAAPLFDRLSNLLTFGRGPPAAPKVGCSSPPCGEIDWTVCCRCCAAAAARCLLHQHMPAGCIM